MAEPHHSIKAVAQRTGLSAHVIRVWERRYRAVEPGRTSTNRRRYSDEEIERLSFLRDLTHGGHSIGAVAQLPIERLRELVTQERNAPVQTPAPSRTSPERELLRECVKAVNDLDSANLERVLNRGALELGSQGLLLRVIAPLAETIGQLWHDGSITAAHEHFASAVIRVFLGHAIRSFSGPEGSPLLVVGTPSGQLHELGALLVGAAASNLGWNVTYLGASLPAAELAGAARLNRARALALSLVYPEDDPRLENELLRLRQLLPAQIPILVGGRAMSAYRPALNQIGALQISDLVHLCFTLDKLRKPSMA